MPLSDMRYIGHGWQYRVYDLGNGRVLKRPQPFLRQFYIVMTRGHHLEPFKKIRELRCLAREAERQIPRLGAAAHRLMGNPTYHPDGSYEQDLLTPFFAYVKGQPNEVYRQVFDKYVDMLIASWHEGFSEQVFNFLINSGLTKAGAVIQMDLGELSFSREEVEAVITTKRWLHHDSYVRLADATLKQYVAEQFEKRLTVETLRRVFRTRG